MREAVSGSDKFLFGTVFKRLELLVKLVLWLCLRLGMASVMVVPSCHALIALDNDLKILKPNILQKLNTTTLSILSFNIIKYKLLHKKIYKFIKPVEVPLHQ